MSATCDPLCSAIQSLTRWRWPSGVYLSARRSSGRSDPRKLALEDEIEVAIEANGQDIFLQPRVPFFRLLPRQRRDQNQATFAAADVDGKAYLTGRCRKIHERRRALDDPGRGGEQCFGGLPLLGSGKLDRKR